MHETANQEIDSSFRVREEAQPSIASLIAVFIRSRRFLLWGSFVGGVLGLGAASLRQPVYVSDFSFVPEITSESGRSGLASLAGQIGLSLGAVAGQGSSPQLYADILRSREVLGALAKSSFSSNEGLSRTKPLPELLKIVGPDSARSIERTIVRLRKELVQVEVAARTTGVVSVRIRSKDPDLSFQLAARLLHELQLFNLRARQRQASAERKFLDARIKDARIALQAAEEMLQGFLRRNRDYRGSPELLFEHDRLHWEVTSRQQLQTNLRQQYEDARIREVRDTPVISLIDRPALPRDSEPRRLLVTLIGGLALGMLLSMAAVLLRNVFVLADDAKDPGVRLIRAEWRELTGRRSE
jgi:uncharacterized protein involved in exopolysaccharide biosynthesis